MEKIYLPIIILKDHKKVDVFKKIRTKRKFVKEKMREGASPPPNPTPVPTLQKID